MSEQKKELVIGLFGFGVVGNSLWDVLQGTPELQARIKKVCVKRGDKLRAAPGELFTTDAGLLLDDPEINVIVELIDDAEAAYCIVTNALRGGKAVVSANKKMIAGHLEELLELQQQYQTPFLYEAACCASIPVIRNLEEYYDNDLLRSVSGIVNGSTNYILTKIANEKLTFQDALTLAQKAGFAERDPSLDVAGTDAVNKLSILLLHAFGIPVSPLQIFCCGIDRLNQTDAEFAAENGYAIKLVAHAGKLSDGSIAAFVVPQFVEPDSKLFAVENEYNGVIIESSFADKQFFYGKGAGGLATASAVLSDLSALRYRYRYEYKKRAIGRTAGLADNYLLKVYGRFSRNFESPETFFQEVWHRHETAQNVIITGLVSIQQLQSGRWWQSPDVSVILFGDTIVEQPYDTTVARTVTGCVLGEI